MTNESRDSVCADCSRKKENIEVAGECSDGESVASAVREQQPDLVLLDIKMPKVDGIEVLRQIKADARSRTVPVVVMTSSNEERDVVESYRLGVNSYIVKPIEFANFLDVVASIGLYWVLTNRVPA